MKLHHVILIPISAGLIGCAATPLQAPEAAGILLTQNAPAAECNFVGEVRGSQGNGFTAEFTKDEDILIGARNQLRDAAYKLGANYVQIELENASHNTADYSSGGIYNSTVIGNAYLCPSVGSAQFVAGPGS